MTDRLTAAARVALDHLARASTVLHEAASREAEADDDRNRAPAPMKMVETVTMNYTDAPPPTAPDDLAQRLRAFHASKVGIPGAGELAVVLEAADAIEALRARAEAARRETEGSFGLSITAKHIDARPPTAPDRERFLEGQNDRFAKSLEAAISENATLTLRAEAAEAENKRLREERDAALDRLRVVAKEAAQAGVRAEAAEADAKRLREAGERLANAADDVGVQHFDTDTMPTEVAEMQAATQAMRAALAQGGNDRLRDDDATARTADQMPGLTKLLGGDQ